jgi:hypothetical protein
MKDNKTAIVVTLATVAILIVGVLGASYAYFAAQIGNASNTTITAQSNSVDSLVFSPQTCTISFTATQANFGTSSTSPTGSCTIRATLTANNAANASYNVRPALAITTNNFVDTNGQTNKDLVLTIVRNTSNNGAAASSKTIYSNVGLTGKANTTVYVAADTATTLSTSPVNYSLTANAGQTSYVEYVVTVTLNNQNANQNDNINKSFNATFTLGKV